MEVLIDPEEIREAQGRYLLALLECDGRIGDACVLANIRLPQVEGWRQDEAFAGLERHSQLLNDDKLRQKIHDHIEHGDIRVLLAAMKRLPEYQPKSTSTVTHQGEIKHRAIALMDDAEKDVLILEGAACIEAEFNVVDSTRKPQSGGDDS